MWNPPLRYCARIAPYRPAGRKSGHAFSRIRRLSGGASSDVSPFRTTCGTVCRAAAGGRVTGFGPLMNAATSTPSTQRSYSLTSGAAEPCLLNENERKADSGTALRMVRDRLALALFGAALLEHLVRLVGGHLVVALELHREVAHPLGQGAQLRRVGPQLRVRRLRVDERPLRGGLHPQDLPASRGHVRDHLAQHLVRDHDLQPHHRLEQDRLRRVADAVIDRGDELPGDDPAHDSALELHPRAARQRLQLDVAVPILPATAALPLVLPLR